MGRRAAGMLATAALLILTCAGTVCAGTGRAVSLNALAAASKAGKTSEVANLCGITEVRGFIRDKANNDIVIFGKADPALPVLQLDDLAVALRNVWTMYAEVEDGTRYFSAPGCSIDPDPKVLSELKALGARAQAGGPGNDMESIATEWTKVGSRAQSVRVMGIPFDTRFARVMVEADYHLKRLVNGTATLDIPGLVSLADLKAERVRNEIASGKMSQFAVSLNRFWFNPGECTYDVDDGAFTLRSCRVCVLTEVEFLSAQGGVTHTGTPDELAGRFAASVGAHYDKLAAAHPIYKELEGLFRLVTVARIIKDSNAYCPGLEYLLKAHKIATSPLSRQLPGVTSVKRMSQDTSTSEGVATHTMVMPTCGGVSMDVEPKKVPATKRAVPLKKTVLGARKPPKAISWDFPLD